MRRFFSVLVIAAAAMVAGCGGSSSSDSAATYRITFDMTVDQKTEKVSIDSSNVFSLVNGVYEGDWIPTAVYPTAWIQFALPEGELPVTFTSGMANFYFGYEPDDKTYWSDDSGFTLTITQMTPTIKGTFSGLVKIVGGTTASVTNGTFEGSLVQQ